PPRRPCRATRAALPSRREPVPLISLSTLPSPEPAPAQPALLGDDGGGGEILPMEATSRGRRRRASHHWRRTGWMAHICYNLEIAREWLSRSEITSSGKARNFSFARIIGRWCSESVAWSAGRCFASAQSDFFVNDFNAAKASRAVRGEAFCLRTTLPSEFGFK
ncbi:hypothetical protein EJB05_34851, partial [Eragrostis curvula]